MREVTDMKEFFALVDSGARIVVWFGATWCGPCQELDAAAIHQKATSLALTLIHVDVDAGAKIAAACKITKIPTFITFSDGEPDIKITTANTTAVLGFLDRFADRH